MDKWINGWMDGWMDRWMQSDGFKIMKCLKFVEGCCLKNEV